MSSHRCRSTEPTPAVKCTEAPVQRSNPKVTHTNEGQHVSSCLECAEGDVHTLSYVLYGYLCIYFLSRELVV